MRSSGGFIAALLEILRSIFGRKTTPTTPVPAPPPVPSPAPRLPDNRDEPAREINSKVLLLVYDPVMDPQTGVRLSEQQRWNRVDQLVNRYIADIVESSGGLARYQVVERLDLDEFPEKVDGFRYTPASYLEVVRRTAAPRTPHEVSYQAILDRFDILQRVADQEIDEVWVFAFPHAGFFESTMGGVGAFWCNAPPLPNTSQCPRRFVVMGFSYERGMGEMLESFGHRCESILEKTFSPFSGDANLWKRFTLYDKIAPGRAEVGTIHFAPNSERDYDWNNPRPVPSRCDDWLNFPDFKNETRMVTSTEWGNGDIRLHHRWWMKRFPKVAGRTNGVAHNWWQYVIDPNQV